MNARTIVARATVEGAPAWTPAVLAGLARLYRTPETPECTQTT